MISSIKVDFLILIDIPLNISEVKIVSGQFTITNQNLEDVDLAELNQTIIAAVIHFKLSGKIYSINNPF